LKVEGSAGCAAATSSETTASESASRVVAMILERRPIDLSFAVCGFYQYNVCRAGGELGNGECKCQGKGEAG
jgi:hypothetical protein